jgi:pimeloyl-ACP methyl ester carboxylesterase/UDP:flavonoid glycosyltransferase YjiC (YdhE family)
VTVLQDRAVPASRAVTPAASGFADSGGVRIAWEVFGEGEDTLLLLPPWSIIHSRFWKQQVPYLSRHFRVVTFDPRGNGSSDRPAGSSEYGPRVSALDALAVLEATGTESCVLVAHCAAAGMALLLAAEHADRVRGALFMSPALPLTPPRPERTGFPFDEERAEYAGWAKANRHHWNADFRDYLEFFFDRCYPEPHSTKPLEDSLEWGLDGSAETLAYTMGTKELSAGEVRELLARVRCPLLVLQGDEDLLIPDDRTRAFAEETGAELVELEGVGHAPNARHPVRFNLVARDFAARTFGRSSVHPPWRRSMRRPKRALLVSSPIGLGHAWRDVAIARELRALVPGLEIDWLAQDPVTRVLEASGERIHPASALLANESRHIAAESREHELNVFQAWRRMDEILLANFMVFHDLVRDEPYDLWIGDEAWELDYYLHENPELKTAPYVFLTDFVGWLPMAEGGEREAFLTADYNAEMIGHIERFPWVRDRAVFVGGAEDVVPDSFGPGLPAIGGWVEEHFDFAGYVLAPDAGEPVSKAELGYDADAPLCIVTVGGSGVGGGLLRRVIESFPAARELVPGLRMVAVCGPRIDPGAFEPAEGLELVPYVHQLSRHLAAADVAVVQGGLTTCMELAAAQTPFLYFPLRRHFEQNLHVRYRLERYGAGRAMDFETSGPGEIAAGIAGALAGGQVPAPVERDGASRAASLIAELL